MRTDWARRSIDRLAGGGMVVETTSLSGYLRLYALAGLRRWRRSSLRFQREHRKDETIGWRRFAHWRWKIARWLARWPNAPRLIKGYGDTHVRGSLNYETIMKTLPRLREMDRAAERFKRLRQAALADDTGLKLEAALKEVIA